MLYDKRVIKLNVNNENSTKNKSNHTDFCYKMYQNWVNCDNPIDIPVLIVNNDNLLKNKDVNIIPRIYMKYYINKVSIPFIYKDDKYVSLTSYFKKYLNKTIPSITEFQNIIIEKNDLEEHEEFFEAINLFLYSSFLLKQFLTGLNIIKYYYIPISDEAKYYFYIIFDYMRRKCIEENMPLSKKDIVKMVKQLALLNNKLLTKSLFLKTFEFIDENIFDENNDFFLLNENNIFSLSFVKENESENEDIII